VGIKRNTFLEGIGHNIPMAQDMCELAAIKPELDNEGKYQGEQENQGNPIHDKLGPFDDSDAG
jgi:hypothetical protein